MVNPTQQRMLAASEIEKLYDLGVSRNSIIRQMIKKYGVSKLFCEDYMNRLDIEILEHNNTNNNSHTEEIAEEILKAKPIDKNK